MNKIISTAQPELLGMSYLPKVQVRSQLIYSLLLLAIIVALALLPLIQVDVSVRAPGLLQSPIEKNELMLPISGHISYLNLRDNQHVKKGDTLLRINAHAVLEQDRLVVQRIAELEQLLQDVNDLATFGHLGQSEASLQSARYRAAYGQYQRQLRQSGVAKEQSQREFARFQQLYDRRVISAVEYEQYLSKRDQALADYEFIGSQYQSQWQADASSYRAELNELYRKRSEWKNQRKFHALLAPTDGSVQNPIGLQEGMPVFANQKVAEITPDSSLIALVYVSPADIGLMRQGQEVHFQVDAFNYNQWGILGGKVLEIAEDMVLNGQQQPVFKVRCQLDTESLVLKNGYVGRLKKGMTVQARFMVARRSLFQLLYDKVDDWVNPSRPAQVQQQANNF